MASREEIIFLDADRAPLAEQRVELATWVLREIRDDKGSLVERYTYYGPQHPRAMEATSAPTL